MRPDLREEAVNKDWNARAYPLQSSENPSLDPHYELATTIYTHFTGPEPLSSVTIRGSSCNPKP